MSGWSELLNACTRIELNLLIKTRNISSMPNHINIWWYIPTWCYQGLGLGFRGSIFRAIYRRGAITVWTAGQGVGSGHLEAPWPEAGCECNVFVKPSSDGAGEEEAANGESLWEGTSC